MLKIKAFIMNTKFKINYLKHSQELFDLMMQQEGDYEHVNEPRIRLIWHLLGFSLISILLFKTIILPILIDYSIKNSDLTFYVRTIILAMWILIIFLVTLLGYRHYKFMILSGKDLRFKTIAFLFILCVFCYGFFYQALYILQPDLFSYILPVVVPKPTTTVLPFILSWKFNVDFIIYSLCVALNMDSYSIVSSSRIVTIINSFQTICNVLLVVVLIASFVQKKSDENNKIT
jgi:hypothetical protein